VVVVLAFVVDVVVVVVVVAVEVHLVKVVVFVLDASSLVLAFFHIQPDVAEEHCSSVEGVAEGGADEAVVVVVKFVLEVVAFVV